MRPIRTLAPLGLIALFSGCASVGTISGTLSGQVPPPPPGNAEPAHEGRTGGGSVADAVVYVERFSHEAESQLPSSPETTRVEETGLSFRPRVVAVVAGSSVEFANRDSVFHNAFSVSPSNRFDLGRYAPGETRRVKLRTPGIVNVYCDLHPKMAAFVLVVPNRAFARADSLGRFVLPPLPPGRYVVDVWHPDFPTVRRAVTVSPGRRAEINIRLGS